MSERSEDVANGVRSSKIIVKESSLQVNSSSRIYYYGGASVPFLWETRPGTPKHSLFSESFRLPPLTPPPSYYSSFSGNKLSKVRPKQTRFVKTFFNGNHHLSRPSFSWSSTTSSASSSSSSSSPRSKTLHRARTCYLPCSRSYVKDNEEEEEIGSSLPTSTLAYKRGFRSSMGSMKRAFCSVLWHGSSRNDLRLI
ncbi:hypothetical protein Bca4012_018064 [Brassica carinata]|uniref:Uncharacterized protein n=1 Tax=Brassica carinata TaxID=52824 RepID=A0A8X7WMX5_BRACI|nr:hypothetical protein Bca52824_003537 [Brassica carinata]